MRTKERSAAVTAVIVLCLCICLLFSGCSGEKNVESEDSYYRTVLIDCGRGYYTNEAVEKIIDQMSASGFGYLMLAFGNDGLRFLLDDMSVEAGGETIDGSVIKDAVISANDRLAPDAEGYWQQSDMDEILEYAEKKNISIIPLVNSPGHATAIANAMESAGIHASLDNRNGSTDSGSVTIDVTNETAVEFMYNLICKYVEYFKGKGCRYFNIGMDEYAGNTGGWSCMSDAEKTCLENYLQKLTDTLTAAQMTPMVFCDVVGNMETVPSQVIGINWNGTGLKDHKNLNANYNWYYVLGNTGYDWAGYDKAYDSLGSILLKESLGDPAEDGCMLAAWNDNYLLPNDYIDNIISLIKRMSECNRDYFK